MATDKEELHVYLPPDLMRRLRRAAQEQRRSVSVLVEMALAMAMGAEIVLPKDWPVKPGNGQS